MRASISKFSTFSAHVESHAEALNKNAQLALAAYFKNAGCSADYIIFSDLPTEPKEEPPAIQADVQYANGETDQIFQDEGQSVRDYLDHVRTIVNLFSKEGWFSKS